jgi:hypothetical protein
MRSTLTRTAASLINLHNAYTIVIDRNNFAQCQVAILGRPDVMEPEDPYFSNVIQISDRPRSPHPASRE